MSGTDVNALRITVDEDLCRGHGRCYAEHPELFDSDDEGFSVVIKTLVSGTEMDRAEAAAVTCPERAILLARAVDDTDDGRLRTSPTASPQ